MRVGTNIYWLWLRARPSTPMISVNTLNSPARELLLPTTYIHSICTGHNQAFLSQNQRGLTASLSDRGRCRQPRLRVSLMHCVVSDLWRGFQNPYLPCLLWHKLSQQSPGWTAVPWQVSNHHWGNLETLVQGVLGMNYSLTRSGSPDGERRKTLTSIGEYFRFKNSTVGCQPALLGPP